MSVFVVIRRGLPLAALSVAVWAQSGVGTPEAAEASRKAKVEKQLEVFDRLPAGIVKVLGSDSTALRQSYAALRQSGISITPIEYLSAKAAAVLALEYQLPKGTNLQSRKEQLSQMHAFDMLTAQTNASRALESSQADGWLKAAKNPVMALRNGLKLNGTEANILLAKGRQAVVRLLA
jgi:hypothetical protein